jgi:hypothetical protein
MLASLVFLIKFSSSFMPRIGADFSPLSRSGQIEAMTDCLWAHSAPIFPVLIYPH